MDVRRASIADLPALGGLFHRYRCFYGRSDGEAAARNFIAERLERGDSVVFVATVDDVAVGFVQLFPSYSSLDMARLWILNDLYVAEAARRHGAGRALLERARRLAIETGATRLELETGVDNFAARRLYEREGWTRDTDFVRYGTSVPASDRGGAARATAPRPG